jgi:hypothetical protein
LLLLPAIIFHRCRPAIFHDYYCQYEHVQERIAGFPLTSGASGSSWKQPMMTDIMAAAFRFFVAAATTTSILLSAAITAYGTLVAQRWVRLLLLLFVDLCMLAILNFLAVN